MSAITYTTDEVDNRKVFRFNWINTYIPHSAYAALRDYFKKSNNYAPLNATRRHAIGTKLASINKQHKCNIDMIQCLSIHHMCIKEKIIKSYGAMNALMPRMAREYNKGTPIVSLARKYDFPPLNLLRGILLFNGMDASAIHRIFADKQSPEELLTGRNIMQFKTASAHDADSVINQKEIAQKAQVNEDKFVAWFIKLGVRMRTQEQLVAQQVKRYGRAISTPDILFLDTVFINGERVAWIDWKSYILTDVNFIHTSNIKQADRYTAEWGRGAICYQMGLVSDISVNSALLIDGCSLPIKFIEDLY